MFTDDQFSLAPANFFQIRTDCHRLQTPKAFLKEKPSLYLLPDTTTLLGEENFAKVYLGWHEEGIECLVDVKVEIQRVYYPEVYKGDSIELMFDTRDVKTSGYNTRFCHHFVFLPEAFESHQAAEITRFRQEDVHPLCDPAELEVKLVNATSRSYQLFIAIPATCLHGYDPEQFRELGFTYRINRYQNPSQHFSVSSRDYQIEQQPSLWSSLRLVK